MPNKKRSSRSEVALRPWIKGRRAAIAIAVVISLFAGWTMLAYSTAPQLLKRKGKGGGAVSIQSFNSNSPSKEYVYAGGRLVATEEPTSGGCTAPSAPGTLTATALSATSVSVSWAPSPGTVDHYEVERRNGSGPFSVIANIPAASGTSITDTSTVVADTAYLYRVRAFADQAEACPSPYSSADLATTTIFTSDPPVGVGSTIYAVHLLRLRTAVNAVRATAGLSAFDWADSTTPVTVTPAVGGTILKEQVQKLRNRLNEARSGLGLPLQSYTNEPLAAGTTVYASHILELRQGVQ